ncbi:hypothetical protein OH76DRAFT_1200848 [Lentinus brumalis]|uniref:Uncharacterized protein n=1 Tax=Lentinus brumalis TaxID=2498619 RepID=A0A371CT60_9APHY|nr:hypothetical protein OH76DRAFT_1200848 [Polyporus brumalis]
MQFALQQVTPQLRILICASRNREGEAYAHITRYCSRNDILPRVVKALERCAHLEELELDPNIPGFSPALGAGAGIPDLRLPRLSSVHLGGTLEVVRAVFEHLDIRDTTRITLYTDHLPTADLLPRRNLSAVIPGIRSLAIYVHSACILNHSGSFDGEIECGDRRLSLHFEHPSFDRPRPAVQRFDLRVFFQGRVGVLLALSHHPPQRCIQRVPAQVECRTRVVMAVPAPRRSHRPGTRLQISMRERPSPRSCQRTYSCTSSD